MCQIASARRRGEVDLGDLGAALLADPCLGVLKALAVDGPCAGMGGTDERVG
jgi:hypothetical protein